MPNLSTIELSIWPPTPSDWKCFLNVKNVTLLCSWILALRWRCRAGRRTARMSDAAFLLTKKLNKIAWSDSIFKTCKNYIELLIYKILWPWVFYFGRDQQNAYRYLVQCGWSTFGLIIPTFLPNALLCKFNFRGIFSLLPVRSFVMSNIHIC